MAVYTAERMYRRKQTFSTAGYEKRKVRNFAFDLSQHCVNIKICWMF